MFYKNYFSEFFDNLPVKVQDKIDEVLYLVMVLERIPLKFSQHMKGTDGLYEIRVEFSSDIYRIFCCFDDGDLVILFNGFQKKSQKTPRKEIEKALRLKADYFKEKQNL
ncbi:type II toxin-antitoxin system RelE/ParE family toxin [Lunatimonas salinarum]|uniref:type II toxin-antitoxin system RelE/ParE family toxin n=1 Tax=Lunatimonas salinarum TaxID=1774590 RepID=UPI0031594F1C